MRIVFLAVDDEFAWRMQKHLYGRRPEWIVGSVISSSLVYRKSTLGAALFLLRRSGWVYVAQMVKMKVIRRLLEQGHLSPSALAKEHGVDTYYTRDINGEDSLARLRAWRPDLIISTNFSQYVGKKARDIPAVGAWNLHKSYLPRYRGMAPNFHALREGAESVGATLHVMEKGFDTGDILIQVSVPVQDGDTVYELNKRTADAGGRMLLEFLERLDPTNVHAVPQPDGGWRTYSYPTRADLREFRRRGCRF
jgi:folate-dependent phosphoribosylglycinamide formyltransferase PurN